MKLTGMQKILITAAGIAVVFVAVFVLLILPMFGRLSELDQKQRDAEGLISTTQATLAQLRESKTKAPETQARLVRLSNQMPDNPELPSLIVDLQNLCNDAGMQFASITPAKPEYKGGQSEVPADLNYTEIRIDLQVIGTWDDLLDLLRRLNKLVRVNRITNISIGPDTSAAGAVFTTQPPEAEHPALNVLITLKAFVIGDNGALVSAESVPTSAPPPAEGTAP
jgi:type IV pilus assembly protein PilO